MKTQNKVNLRNSFEENMSMYPESWEHREALEDYVSTLWDYESDRAEDLEEDFETYSEYLFLHIEILAEIKRNGDLPENINNEIFCVIYWYEAGFLSYSEDYIHFEKEEEIPSANFVHGENPNFEDDPDNEPAMVWCVEGFDDDGNHYEGDDFEYFIEAIHSFDTNISE